MKLTPEAKPQFIKLFLLGYQGTGKSWSYVSLGIPNIIPGWKPLELRILDFDGKAEEVIRSALSHALNKAKIITKEQHDAALANFDVVVCRENTGVVNVSRDKKTVQEFGVKGIPVAWKTAVKQLQVWESSWNSDKVLIVDSLTHAVKAIVNFEQDLNGRLNQTLLWNQYDVPQQKVEQLMTLVADTPANSIMIGHQDPVDVYKKTDKIDRNGQPIQEFVTSVMAPISIGKAKRLQLPSQTNHLLICSTEGSGPSTRRYIYTVPEEGVTTKTPFFGRCRDKYLIDKGMAEYFALR